MSVAGGRSSRSAISPAGIPSVASRNQEPEHPQAGFLGQGGQRDYGLLYFHTFIVLEMSNGGKHGSKPNVLFLCTGNSSRRQMAEGFLRQHGGDMFNVLQRRDAIPPSEVHPMAVEAMAEKGIDISDQRSKVVRRVSRMSCRSTSDYCLRRAANESCPSIFPGMMNRHLWPFDDPATFKGRQKQPRKVSRQCAMKSKRRSRNG